MNSVFESAMQGLENSACMKSKRLLYLDARSECRMDFEGRCNEMRNDLESTLYTVPSGLFILNRPESLISQGDGNT